MKIKMSHLVTASLSLLLAVNSYAASESAKAKITKPSVMPIKQKQAFIINGAKSNGANTTEVFMQVDNLSNKAMSIVAAYSPLAEQVQLHQSLPNKQKNMLEMKEVSQIAISAKSHLTMKSEGFHVTLMGLHVALQEGDTVPIILIFNDGSWVKVNATVA